VINDKYAVRKTLNAERLTLNPEGVLRYALSVLRSGYKGNLIIHH
jgi:hypothetical protein